MKATGCIPTVRSVKDYPLVCSTANLPESASLAQYTLAGRDQRTTQSCVGFGMAQAIYVRLGAMGIVNPIYPSEMAIYYAARARKHGPGNVFDFGSEPRHAWEACRELGIVANADWPFRESRIDVPPDPNAWRKACDNLWLRYYWIDSNRVDLIKAAISNGKPACIEVEVDLPLTIWQPWQGAWRRVGQSIGWHMMCAVGYDPSGLWCANSWGQKGLVLLSWDCVRYDLGGVSVPEIDRSRLP